MSCSYQKTSITGHTHCRSERQDKRLWHKRWRKRERIKLSSLSSENLDDHCTTDRREVSNPWNMGKDGKGYFPEKEQVHFVETLSSKRARGPQEQSSLKKRLLYKMMEK